RMGSSRLPGKVLLPLQGRTVLDHVLTRCQAIRGVDAVCCAVPETSDSDPVAEEAERLGAIVVRGPEQNVLARYDRAARELGAEIVVRVTSDCPLTDPEVDAQVLELLRRTGADYAANNLEPDWPHGLDCEAFSAAALAEAAREARDPYQREHVTPWLREHPSLRRAHLPGPGGDVADLRWTLDYPEDLAFFTAVFEKLAPDREQGYEEVLEVLRAHPEITSINAHRAMARHDAPAPITKGIGNA
ncbi:MAG: glycosyltransferase family protein, partial [Proteobacteria bacterium]|nr:glycosyltransferase family protein [Pseudomonadota bacterium]